ncbi:MAG: hypothetical protein NC483_05760 [Ruminococcus sp.]|nr:hypothetical protein [Ruminococcus sp.]
MYTREEDIIHFIFLAFKGLKRKKEDIDLAFHSIMVGNMLKNAMCDETTVFIGYLHDVIEDTNCTYDDLLKRYGKDISDGVMLLSEDKTIKDYVERKTKFISKLKTVNENILIVEVADKLQNLISDYNLFLEKGKDSLITEADNYNNLKWYYTELQKLFNERIANNILLNRYNDIVKLYFN